MAVSAHDVAAVIRESLPDVGDVKLHKLLYYCQGHHLAAFDEPLFSDTISAWDMGPVVSVFRHDERHGLRPVGEVRMTEGQLNIIGYVISHYGHLTSRELVVMTHGEDPWMEANKGRPEHGSVPISRDSITTYFKAAREADRRELAPFDEEQVARIAAAAREHLEAAETVELDDPAAVLAWTGR